VEQTGKPARRVACPRCGARAEWSSANAFRPFCSERCKLIDFGAWATESYRIPERGATDPSQRSDEESTKD